MPVTLNQSQWIAAGRVLQELGPDADIQSLRVDGVEVNDLGKAREAFSTASTPVADETPGVFDRISNKLADKTDALEDKLEESSWGRKLRKLIAADPERVVAKVLVEAKLADGTEVKLPVAVLNREATEVLQRTSSISEAIGMIPLLGYAAPAITAAGTAIGAGISRLFGKRALAGSMWKTAGKHAALFATGLIPVLGSATSAVAAAIDLADARDVARAVSVAEIIELK